ncbi:major facilitator superfamily domain-containing protein [Hypoxylon sp. FL1284]|nr:major facilitator superfamily domain-containing protein [Hypoxylon sp. FL1284]
MSATETTRLLHHHVHVNEHVDEQEVRVIDWDGPDDPENPLNWSSGKRWGHVTIVSLLTFLVPLGATMFAPAIQQVMNDFGSSNDVISSLIVSIYVLGWALGPLIVAPLSEVHGRLAVYTASNVLYVVFTAACAVAPNLGSLVFFRLMAGSMGSTPLTIGGGTISDLVPVQQRGLALSLYMFGPILGPSVGPLLGGLLTQALGWRWIFWVLTIVYTCMTVAQIAIMRETFPAAILQAKTTRLQKETGITSLRSKLDSGLSSSQILARAVIRPARMTATSTVNLALSLVSAYVNGVVFLLLTTAPVMYETRYGFSARAVGLAFVGFGAGNVAGLALFGASSDRFVRRQAARGTLAPEHRLAPALAGAPLLALGLLAYGWAAQARVHWAAPVAGSALVGAGNVLLNAAVVGYLIDAFTAYAASAVAANTVIRSLGGTLLPLVGRRLYAALDWGGGSSLLAVFSLLCAAALAYLYAYGAAVRAKQPVRF